MQAVQYAPQMNMRIEDILSENQRMKSENEHLVEENQIQKGQIANLKQVNVLASNIVRLSETAGNPAKKALIQRTVVAFVVSARDIILSGKNNVAHLASNIRDLVIKICNFVWDNLEEIGIAAVIAPAITLCAGVTVLSLGILSGHLQIEPLTGAALEHYDSICGILPSVSIY